MKQMLSSCFLLFVIIMAGCSSVAYIQTDDVTSEFTQKPDPDNIKVYSDGREELDYDVIGQVIADADAGSNAETAVTLLKKQAAQLGADAIINLRLEIDSGYWQSAIKATGTAIKFK
ncbi:heavy metal-binding domain-containing protein [candidate division KSB1 bacterium]|nr:heavy metal-binding domain-containing protein [candidate division KSB1 bacterium]